MERRNGGAANSTLLHMLATPISAPVQRWLTSGWSRSTSCSAVVSALTMPASFMARTISVDTAAAACWPAADATAAAAAPRLPRPVVESSEAARST